MSRREPQIQQIPLEELIRRSLERVQTTEQRKDVSIEITLDPVIPFILADRADMEALFFHLLQNSLEAVNPDKATVRILSTTDTSLPDRVLDRGLQYGHSHQNGGAGKGILAILLYEAIWHGFRIGNCEACGKEKLWEIISAASAR